MNVKIGIDVEIVDVEIVSEQEGPGFELTGELGLFCGGFCMF